MSRFRAILARWRLSLFEKVILANSVIVVGEALVGLWVTSHNLEAHHYLIDTSFIVLSTLLALLTNVVLLRASFRPLFRQGLKLLLGRQADMQVVGEARTGREAIALAQELAPDVVVMDITMPDMDGLIATRHIRAHRSATQVLMLTMHESEEYFLQALRVGAVGYLVKKAAPTDLQMAIRAVAHGDAFLYPGLAKALVRAYLSGSTTNGETSEAIQAPPSEPSTPLAKARPQVEKSPGPQLLTPRELEVLTLVAEGYTSQQIANRLVLSVKTVQAHRANIMEKLGLRDITHLVRFAIRHGLIQAEL